jgi:hypothetical protein
MLEVNADVMNMFTQSYGLTAAELTKVSELYVMVLAIEAHYMFRIVIYIYQILA